MSKIGMEARDGDMYTWTMIMKTPTYNAKGKKDIKTKQKGIICV